MKKFFLSILIIVISFVCICCENSDKTQVNSYEITVVLNEDMTADCRLKLNYVNNVDNLDYLLFNLYPNAFSNGVESPVYPEYYFEAYPNGIDLLGIPSCRCG